MRTKKPAPREVWQVHHITYDPERVVRIRRKVHYLATVMQRYKNFSKSEKEALRFIIDTKPEIEEFNERSEKEKMPASTD